MKCNVRELAHMSDQPCVLEGRLNYRKGSHSGYLNQAAFKERWFRLVNNCLFYFKISDMGKFDTKNPAGVFVMENSSIEMEHGQGFAFSISFFDEPEKRHLFTARSEDNVVQWVFKLRACSYEYLRGQLHALQSKIFSMTGKDPLLLVPRNEGAKLWAPSVPFSTAPACTVGKGSFSCHLHTNGIYSLERSKSDVQAHSQLHKHRTKAKFYTDADKDKPQVKEAPGFLLERSKTSVIQHIHINDASIFDNRPAYSRAAPSPPVRKKPSPSAHRADMSQESTLMAERGKSKAYTGILDPVPVPPRRKVSPRTQELPDLSNLSTNGGTNQSCEEDDLIKF